ncbi:DoxX family protein [Streptomyces thermodiastaticus]|uniref:DoxX family protein n=1 Tax=Streptomyces thermodiastaticus TaxID=44061 RepID=UPI0016728CDB|nr:DoxX family protein [Streptomyces thermodiastaticus]MCE7552005.1 DoxX family protein [Streptomyces thermodiastaticus]
MHYTFAGLSIGLAALFAITGSAKLLRAPWTLTAARRLGCSENAFRAIGALEAAAVVGLLAGLLWGPLGIAAAVGLVALLVGAVIAHRRAGDPVRAAVPPAWLALAAAAAVVTGALSLS